MDLWERIITPHGISPQVTFKGKPNRVTVGFSMETLKVNRALNNGTPSYKRLYVDVSQVYPEKFSAIVEGEKLSLM